MIYTPADGPDFNYTAIINMITSPARTMPESPHLLFGRSKDHRHWAREALGNLTVDVLQDPPETVRV